MMPVIRVPESTYRRLQSIAEPFIDTPVTVIERLIDEHEAHHQLAQTDKNSDDVEIHVLGPDTPHDLRHTRVLRARIGAREIRKPRWNKLVHDMHRLAMQKGHSLESLARLTLSHIKEGEHTDKGFRYLPEENISVQGVSAREAWRNALHLARDLNVPIEVTFEWLPKEEAAYPGKKGRISWSPEQAAE
jgi:hypothetical protein